MIDFNDYLLLHSYYIIAVLEPDMGLAYIDHQSINNQSIPCDERQPSVIGLSVLLLL